MKLNHKIYATALLAGLCTTACTVDGFDPIDTYSDVTEGVQDDPGKEVFFKDKAAVDSHMETLYKQFRDRQEHLYLDRLLLAEAHSDNAYGGTTGAEVIPFENNSIEGSNSVINRDWERYLEDIARANRLIVGIEDVKDPALTADIKAKYVAEAKIFRAFMLFHMVRIWGNVPVITDVAGQITSETIAEVYPQYFPAQKSPKEAYEQIVKYLSDALGTASLPTNSPEDKSRLTKAVAHALLAKAYAEKPVRDYTQVIKHADALEAMGYDLQEDYADLFAMNEDNTDTRMRNTRESILEAQFFSGSGNWVSWMFGRDLSNWDNNFTWAKWVTPSRSLVNAYEREGDKVRYEQSIVWYKANWSNYYPADRYAFMYKIRSAYSSIIYLRYADILLLKAEALIMGPQPDLARAANIIDRVRSRARLPKLTAEDRASKESLLEAYMLERRLELAMEGERWFDLVRLDKVEGVMNTLRDSGRKPRVYDFNQDSYLLPIPQGAVDSNENLKQNPGY